ncbi:MAG: BrnA antitoxin family protein [Synergistaceae bacterium]|nr:BrnA antitoxin family protein [Synergistaceae bacterium]
MSAPPQKEQITIRIDKSVLEFYRRMGKGYQTRMNAVLRSYAETVERRRARDQA